MKTNNVKSANEMKKNVKSLKDYRQMLKEAKGTPCQIVKSCYAMLDGHKLPLTKKDVLDNMSKICLMFNVGTEKTLIKFKGTEKECKCVYKVKFSGDMLLKLFAIAEKCEKKTMFNVFEYYNAEKAKEAEKAAKKENK